MTEIRRYTKKPITIEAVQLRGYGDFTRAVKWINANGGSAVFAPATRRDSDLQKDYLIIQTLEGNMEAPEGWFVIKGVKGEFYACEPEIFNLSYEDATEPVEIESRPDTGLVNIKLGNSGALKATA